MVRQGVQSLNQQHSFSTMDPGKEGNIALLEGAVWEEWMGVVRAEERSNLLRGLIIDGVGTGRDKAGTLRQSLRGTTSTRSERSS